MMPWLLIAIAVVGLSGIPGSCFSRSSRAGEWLSVVLLGLGSSCGLGCCVVELVSPEARTLALPWRVPAGALWLRVDVISAMFLAQIFLVALLGAVYGLGYFSQADHPDNARKLRAFYGLMAAGMALAVSAYNTTLFLAAWEVMAVAAFFCVTTEDESAAVRAAGYVYLAAAHLGTLCLWAMFTLLHTLTGSFELTLVAAADTRLASVVFVLALLGFGLKAGAMPLHFWLPAAHANAPSHVSAMLSGVVLKVGVYGLLRVCSLFPHPPVLWGELVLGVGMLSGVLGVAFAIGQHDLKRLLAYHSVENIGIIYMGLGLALLGRSFGRVELVALGLAGCLLHVWNHGLFKALLFLSAGSVVHATGTREMDHLGGLQRRMPKTALGFLVGAVAICGLPPLNGFVSELLIYLGFFRATQLHVATLWIAGAFGAPALALIGALALSCFVKAHGAVFLGQERSEQASHAHDPGTSMLGPMAVLAACCLIIGVGPVLLAPVLDHAVRTWAPEPELAASSLVVLAPLRWLTSLGVALAVVVALAATWLRWRTRHVAAIGSTPSEAAGIGTWDCGYARPSSSMQYTSSSFARGLVELFAWALRPALHAPKLRGPFPARASFRTHVSDPVLDHTLVPVTQQIVRALGWLRWLQRGSVHAYLAYVLFAVVVLLLLK